MTGSSLRTALAAAAILLGLGGSAAAQTGSPEAAYMEVTGFVDRASVSFLSREISSAAGSERSALIIVRIDSPGAMDADLGPVLGAIAASTVPVVAWVAAGEAQAGSGAGLIALAAHRTVMSPGATLGPLDPLDLRDFGKAESVDGIIDRALPGPELTPGALAAVRGARVGADEAVELGLADAQAPNVQELLLGLKGLSIRSGRVDVALSDEPVQLRFVKMALLERLVHSAARPEIAYLLLLIGLFGLIFEIYNPGIGFAGVGGGVALAFSFQAFTVLPAYWPAVAALLIGFAVMGRDMKTQSLGPLSYLGLVLLAGGSLLLYRGAHPEISLPLWAAVFGLLMTLAFFVQVMTSAIRARTAKPLPGAEGIIGAVGLARTDLAPDGQVMARGTLWRARTLGGAIGQGSPVKILGVSGLMLMVEPTAEKVPEAEQAPTG
ncbi:MAG: NfeD family protein [Actinomycetota bacterium]